MRTSKHEHFAGDRGFTLVEVIMVVCIMALFAAMAFSSGMSGADRWNANVEVASIQSILSHVRNEALAQSRCITIQSNSTGDALIVTRYKISRTCDMVPANVEDTTTTALREGYRVVTTTANPLVFLPTGGTAHTQTVRWDISAPGPRTFSFTVFPAIGQVRVQ